MSRELLEKAAKAAGIEIGWIDPIWNDPEATPYIHLRNGKLWNPLTDDGDAFRLAVKLGMDVDIDPPRWKSGATWAMADDDRNAGASVAHNGDPYAATRLAIVRAAAAIGEAL